MKHVKKIFVAAVMALVLTVSTVGMVADAAGTWTCSHSWTVEEYVGERAINIHFHYTNAGEKCYITDMEKVYNIRCRSCGEILGERTESADAIHSICP